MQTKYSTAALIVLGAVLIVFAWWVYFHMAGTLPLWVPIVGTVLPFAIAGGNWLMQWMAASRGARQLESAIVADGARASDLHDAEIDRLRSDFDRAVKALKTSKLGSGQGSASEALYRLPWYAIIGPPASGKTTVLQNSGLKFPYLPGTGDRLKGIGGTRNCDWWLTNQAIMLDTAGRWSVEEADHDEWLAFLDLLKKHRSGHPLNGIIAAISVAGDPETSISSADETTLKLIAGRMRERLDEITGRLGVALPVYLLFTKCDLISGFVETFSSLSSDARKQVWGFTAPVVHGARRAPGAYFAQQFELLHDTLEQRALGTLSEELDARVLPAIYEFPAQFAALKDKLSFFVEELFDANAYRATPLLRGAYFTSGTQEGAPADMLFEDLADAVRVRPPQVERRDQAKSYFLHDMLMRVVFADASLATATEGELLRKHSQTRWISSGLFAAAAAIGVLSTHSCQNNQSAVQKARTSFEQARREHTSVDAAPSRVSELLALDADVASNEKHRWQFADVGLAQAAQLRDPLKIYYQDALAESVVRPLLQANQSSLLTRTQQLEASNDRGVSQPDADDAIRSELRDALKLQLLLTTPREACTPTPTSGKELIIKRLQTLWAQADSTTTPKDRELLITRYLELSESKPGDVTFSRDARAVEKARLALGEDDQAGRVLTRVVARYADKPRVLEPLASASTVYQASRRVNAAFTVDAWKQLTREFGPDSFGKEEEAWLFGCERSTNDSARAERDSEAFRQKYLKRSEAEWRAFLDGMSVRSPSKLSEAESMLSELASRPGLLGTLFQSVHDNTDLPEPSKAPSSLADAAAEKLKQAAAAKLNPAAAALVDQATATAPAADSGPARAQLKRAFEDFASFGVAPAGAAETSLEPYRRQLDPVLAALKAFRSDETKLDALAVAAQTALDSTDVLIRGHAGAWGDKLRALLATPLAGVAELALHDRGGQVERSYCELVYRPYQEELAGRFPLRADSPEGASLPAFSKFFQPGSGAVWSFLTSQLAGQVAAAGSSYRFTKTQARSLFRPELLQFLERANAVTRAFFPDGAANLRVPFRIRVRGAPGYSSTTFRVGARSEKYDSGAEIWTPLEWPGEQPNLGAELTVTPYPVPGRVGPRPLTVEGAWGLFMILQPRHGAQVLEQSSKLLGMGWKPKDDQHFVKVDFASDDPRSPLLAARFGVQHGGLFVLDIPARITQSGTGCAALSAR